MQYSENGFKISADKTKSIFIQRRQLGIELQPKLKIWINIEEIQIVR
jgi:hypothetical protein